MPSPLARFRPLALAPGGDEDDRLERAVERLHGLDAGDIAVLPEWLAWTPARSEVAFGTLLEIAVHHRLGVITTLNLAPELAEDLPGRVPDARHAALVVVTRHGDVHVPQAKVAPVPHEMAESLGGPGIGITAYGRVNRVRLDVGEALIEVHFLAGSDLWALARLPPPALRGDLLVLLTGLPGRAAPRATGLAAAARAARIARATLLVDGVSGAAELLDGAPEAPWPDPATVRDAFHVFDDERAPTAAALAGLAEREARIPVARSLTEAPLRVGDYPVTIVL